MKKMAILLIALMTISVGLLSGCNEQSKDTDGDGYKDDVDAFPNDATEWLDSDGDGYGDNKDAFPNDATETKDSDNDGVGDNSDAFPNNAYEQYDSDNDGVGNKADKFPYDSTQYADRDYDGYGDNPNGNNPDAFPDDASEWRDSDKDGIGDNADIYDSGNGGLKLTINEFHCDNQQYDDGFSSTPDPYFRVYIEVYDEGMSEWREVKTQTSSVFGDQTTIYSAMTVLVDVDDGDVSSVYAIMTAWDDDFDSDDVIDTDVALTTFNPRTTSLYRYDFDGRLDLNDEMDGWGYFTVEVVGV